MTQYMYSIELVYASRCVFGHKHIKFYTIIFVHTFPFIQLLWFLIARNYFDINVLTESISIWLIIMGTYIHRNGDYILWQPFQPNFTQFSSFFDHVMFCVFVCIVSLHGLSLSLFSASFNITMDKKKVLQEIKFYLSFNKCLCKLDNSLITKS